MATDTQPPLDSFADWIRSSDPQAVCHLWLLERAGRILDGEEPSAHDQRRTLAAELERWRYRHLDARMGRLSPRDLELADALDSAANALFGRASRAPRAAHLVIHDLSAETGPVAEAAAALDPAVQLDELAQRARRLTDERFGVDGSGAARLDSPELKPPHPDPLPGGEREIVGRPNRGRSSPSGRTSAKRRMLLYAPLYVSSYCTNHCTYCGFRHPNPIERRHLSLEEALDEAAILRARGFRHLLLVAGDEPRLTTPQYYAAILRALAAQGMEPAVEIAPQPTEAYAELVAAGACGITLYQETYNEELYALYHAQGTKASFHWRLEGVERAAEAGMGRLGLGILLGLADPREDLLAMIRHARYLRGRFPDRRLAFSLPRIYEAPQGFQTPYPVDDQTFVRMYCALRIAFPEAELVLSTREPAALRNRLARICITQMSAGSRTVPGGYEEAADSHGGQQFPVSDRRTPAEVAHWLRDAGFEPVWTLPRHTPHKLNPER